MVATARAEFYLMSFSSVLATEPSVIVIACPYISYGAMNSALMYAVPGTDSHAKSLYCPGATPVIVNAPLESLMAVLYNRWF